MRSFALATLSLILPFLVQDGAFSQDSELEVLRKIKDGEPLTSTDCQAASKMLETWRDGIATGADWADNPEMEPFLARAAQGGPMGARDRAWAKHCVTAYRFNAELDTDPETYGVQTGLPAGAAGSTGTTASSGYVRRFSGELKAMLIIVGIGAATFCALVVAFLLKRRRAQHATAP